MSKATSYNKGSEFEINFDNRQWTKLEDLYNEQPGEIFRIDGLFMNNKGKYGPRPFIAFGDNWLVDLPMHMAETIERMIADPEVTEEITNKKVGFSVRAYMSKNFNRECYSIRFVDIS